MTIRTLYFASLRETLGSSGEQIELPAAARTVGDLRAAIARRGEPWTALATTKNLRAAVNQVMVGMEAAIRDGDEIAFFPPVTGG
jgi:molybdopterin synthase sulfur carrier subunit